jgi:hypothetical protein
VTTSVRGAPLAAALVGTAFLGAALLPALAGCDRSASVDASPSATSPSPSGGAAAATSTPRTSPPRQPSQPAGRTTPVFVEATAVSCAGYPTGEQVVALLRRTAGILPSGAAATIRMGPLCAGTWQYTVVVVPDHDPLQVVTKGAPSALELVTAGTDVCTPSVKASAPPGIRALTKCDGQ